jgi:hypothetical protein
MSRRSVTIVYVASELNQDTTRRVKEFFGVQHKLFALTVERRL